MRLNIEYIKLFLEKILEHNNPDFDLHIMKDLWSDDKKLNSLVFHMEILADQGIIESSTSSDGIGFGRLSNGAFTISIKPLRLTATGHEFATSLNRPGVFEALSSEFKNLGPKEAVNVVFKLGSKILDKQLSNFIDN